MKKAALIISLLAVAALLAAPLAWAKQPKTPPGQAKKWSTGQATQNQGGPPPWAPAHGYRAKFNYKYWPQNRVYFAPDRGVYFWFSGEGWQMGVKLPSKITLSGSSVSLEMNDERPYIWDKDVLRWYPPDH